MRFGQLEPKKVQVASGPAATLAERNRSARELHNELSASEQATYEDRVEQKYQDSLKHYDSVLGGIEPAPLAEQLL